MLHIPPTHLTTLISSTSPALAQHLNHLYALTAATPPPDPTPALPSPLHPNSLAANTYAIQTTEHASQSPQQPHTQHRVPLQPHKQTKDYHMTTNTTQANRPSSKSERNLIILKANINGFKLLIHDPHADIITIQETKLTSKVKTAKVHNFTTVRNDRLHKAGGGLITLIRDNRTFTTTDIPSTINTQNFKWTSYTLTTLNKSQ